MNSKKYVIPVTLLPGQVSPSKIIKPNDTFKEVDHIKPTCAAIDTNNVTQNISFLPIRSLIAGTNINPVTTPMK